MKRKKKVTFKNNLPFSQCSPVKPEGHKHRYFFSVNPDWQVPLLWQRGLLQALFKKNKNQVWFVTEVTPNLHDRASTINYNMKMRMMMRMIVIITKMMMIIGSLNNDDVEVNENVEKANKFSLPNFFKKKLCTWIELNCIFRWCCLMTCLISRFWTTISDSFYFF